MAEIECPQFEATMVDRYFGMRELSRDIFNGVFPINKVGVLFLLVGRADAFARGRDLIEEAAKLVTSVRGRKQSTWIMFCNPMPRGDDDPRWVRKLHALGIHLRALVQQPRVKFCNLVEEFSSPAGVNQELLGAHGITEIGKWVL